METNANPSSKKKYAVLAAFSITIAVALTVGLIQYKQIASLNDKINSLTTKNSDLTNDKSALTSQNANLSKVVDSQKAQLSAQPDTSQALVQSHSSDSNSTGSQTSAANTSTAPGQFTITGTKNTQAADFSTPGEVSLSGSVHVVYVTIKNLSSSNQMYTALDFTAITDTGEIITPKVYPGPAGQGVWNNSSLAPGGSKDVALLFDQSKNISTLEWKAPGGDNTYLAAIPSFN